MAPGDGAAPNAQLVLVQEGGAARVYVELLHDVRAGDELLVCYGEAFALDGVGLLQRAPRAPAAAPVFYPAVRRRAPPAGV